MKKVTEKVEEVKEVLLEAMSCWEELEKLEMRISGSFMYPKKVRAQLQTELFEELEAKRKEYARLKEEYEVLIEECKKN